MTTYNVQITEDGDDHQDALAEGQGESLAAAFAMLASDIDRDPYPLQAALDEGRVLGIGVVEIITTPDAE